MKSAYRWTFADISKNKILEIQNTGNLTRPAAMVLASRGIESQDLSSFLSPALVKLSDPFELPGTYETAERLWEAIIKGERILIHGDYDTDGITASVLLSEVLRENGAIVEAFLPHRIDDGYGLTAESIDKACSRDISLLITVDCGITGNDAILRARKLGIDVLVTDHHEPAAELPKASAIVDTRLPGTPENLSYLAGVGVAFKTCHAFVKYGREEGLGAFDTDLKEVLDLVALGTIADIVPLLGENRVMVKAGLQVLSKQLRPGVRALCEIASAQAPIDTKDVVFGLVPRCNAAGRMGDPMLTMRLLQSRSMSDASQLAVQLDAQNQKRRELEAEVVEQAGLQLEHKEEAGQAKRTIVVAGENWHQGVLGIVASRLARTHCKPAAVLTKSQDGRLIGSIRSVNGVNLIEALGQVDDCMESFGGHALAAGVSVKPENLEKFCELFESQVCAIASPETMLPELEICGEVNFSEIDGQFFHDLGRLAPFGHGYSEPVFAASDVYPERVAVVANGCHTRGRLRDATSRRSLDFIAFSKRPEDLPEPPWYLIYRPGLNTYKGRCKPQAEILDLCAMSDVAKAALCS